MTPWHDHTLVNQSEEFPVPPQAITSLLPGSERRCPIPYPKDNLEEEIEVNQEQVYEVTQDRDVHSSSYLPILPPFPKFPTRIVVTFNWEDKDMSL